MTDIESARKSLSTHSVEELKIQTEDIETSLELNKQLILDAITGKFSTSRNHDVSNETESCSTYPSRIYDKIIQDNQRLEEAIKRHKASLDTSKRAIKFAEQRALEARQREVTKSELVQEEILKLRRAVQDKERVIQNLERRQWEIEQEIQNCQNEEPIEFEKLLDNLKSVVSKVAKQVRKAELQRDEEAERCKALEAEVKRLRQSVKSHLPPPPSFTQDTLMKDYSLDLNYENYFYGVNKYQFEEVSDSADSSDSSVQNINFPQKLHHESKAKPKLPKLNLSAMNQSMKQTSKLPSPRSELHKLELAYRIKTEELLSLQRIQSHLDAQHHVLSRAISAAKSKMTGIKIEVPGLNHE